MRTSPAGGNTSTCEHPQVRTLIIDCLKYWVEDMHVDGFRFDLATCWPAKATFQRALRFLFQVVCAPNLARYVKLIAEPGTWAGAAISSSISAGLGGMDDDLTGRRWFAWRSGGGDSGRSASSREVRGFSDVFSKRPQAHRRHQFSDGTRRLHALRPRSYNERHNEANLEATPTVTTTI